MSWRRGEVVVTVQGGEENHETHSAVSRFPRCLLFLYFFDGEGITCQVFSTSLRGNKQSRLLWKFAVRRLPESVLLMCSRPRKHR